MSRYINVKLSPDLTKTSEEVCEALVGAQTAEDIAKLLEVPYGQLKHILYSCPDDKKYIEFEIPKKGGGVRAISAPNKSIDLLQRKLKAPLNALIRVRKDVHGIVAGKSIVSNSQRHVKQKYVLNFDLKDFYPSINFGRVRGVFQASPFSMGKKAATVVAQILCYRNQLPQGACTSPIVATHVARRLDAALRELAHKAQCEYTRYADDITISTRFGKFPSSIASYEDSSPVLGEVCLSSQITECVKASGFIINDSKTRLQIRSCRQSVTGLTVNEFPNVERSFINLTRALIYSWKKYGLARAAQYSIGRLPKSDGYEGESLENYFRAVVYGRLAYISMVRGKRDVIFSKLVKPLVEIDAENCPEYIKEVNEMNDEFDVFVGHASEDKDEVVRPIVAALQSKGLKVFYDEISIGWGDSLTGRINLGLARSKIFLAVMSSHSTSKAWPTRELQTALTRNIEGRQTFLPLVVGDEEEVLATYPMIKDRKYVVWSGDAEQLSSDVKEVNDQL